MGKIQRRQLTVLIPLIFSLFFFFWLGFSTVFLPPDFSTSDDNSSVSVFLTLLFYYFFSGAYWYLSGLFNILLLPHTTFCYFQESRGCRQ